MKKLPVKKTETKKPKSSPDSLKKSKEKKAISKKEDIKESKKTVAKTETKKTIPVKKTRKKKKSALKKLGPSEEESNIWESLNKKHKGKKTLYDMKKTFESVSAIQHKNFGLGFIVSQYNNRLRVLFKDGTKTLISNYQNKQ